MTSFECRRYFAEFIGTAALLVTVVGSGIMGERLSDGNVAIALLANTIPTGAILVVLIVVFGPISGAHFNPIVTLAFYWRREITRSQAIVYLGVQIVGAILGVWLAHIMFEEPIFQLSEKIRTGFSQWVAEVVASIGLIGTILLTIRFRAEAVAMNVGLYITAAYWFTSSTSFANPAVSIARCLSNTFTGIRPEDVFAFVVAQCVGAAVATRMCQWLIAPYEVDPEETRASKVTHQDSCVKHPSDPAC